MENYEDDDDTHFCIKCHATISGLESYVRHRQSGCCRPPGKEGGDQGASSVPSTVSYPEVPNADAFFNSLELQSSAKKPQRRAPRARVNSARKDPQRQSEGRKRPRRSQVEAEDVSNPKAQLVSGKLNILPVDAELDNPTDHLSIPSLVGFPDIVSSSSSKPAGTTSSSKMMKIDAPSYTPKPETPLENSLDTFMADEAVPKPAASSKRGEVWLGDTILADHHLGAGTEAEGIAHSSALSRYVDYDYVDDVETDDECTPDEDMGDDESCSETDDANDPEYPPQEHTGGKWRPGLATIPQADSELVEDEVEPDEDNPERPPPSHTGGKWKPSDNTHGQRAEDEEKEPSAPPPPSHTRGKWVPGARSDQNNGFYCSPCGRTLATRILYNRHLLTELHAKRSIRELDGVLRLPRGAESLGLRESRGTWRRTVATWKVKENEDTGASKRDGKKSRHRKREVTQCEMCRTWVRRPHMGKHLLSHYHCRVAGVIPRSPRARAFLLDNMANIVRRCPFQCAGCRFYCNTEETFLLHWRSELHVSRHREISGIFRCTACDYWCDGNSEMECHMRSLPHRQVVSMMNGSVPVVIARQRRLRCDTCGQDFRYNRQLMDHVWEAGHAAESASDAYQSRLPCPDCDQVFRSPIALQRHRLSSRTKNSAESTPDASKPYFCSICSMTFPSAQEALRHRKSSRHRETVEDRKSARSGIERRKECPNCSLVLPDLEKLKEHLLQEHVELCHRCPRCGLTFALSQNLAMHTRKRECVKEAVKSLEESVEDSSAGRKCSQCPFVTNSEAESIYHDTLHAGSSAEVNDATAKIRPTFGCPICGKSFKAQQYLLRHIRMHTGEKPYPCPTCKAPFAKRSMLNLHRTRCSAVSGSRVEDSGRRRNYACPECDDAFYTNHALQQHTLRHTGKKYLCGLPGCPTALRTQGELRTHRKRIHGTPESKKTQRCTDCSYQCLSAVQLRRHQKQQHSRPGDTTTAGNRSQDSAAGAGGFRCPYTDCHFKSKLKSHLQRHLRLHTGSKPYRCAYCSYASNNFENLRKHVLTTRIHPGKNIYECTHCSTFRTNFSRELRAHLLQDHRDNFPNAERAASHVASMYSADREPDPTSGLDDQASLSCRILLLKRDNV